MKTITLILSIFLSSLNFLSAEISEKNNFDITIHVKGLVCDFCARSVEKTFSKTEVVERIKVDLDKGLIELQLTEGSTLSDKKIQKLIKASGYSLESIERNK